MSDLANYSIETDQLVWLSFKDGKNLRVPVGQLPTYLAPRDLQRVRRAMRMRRDFLRHHMPGPLLLMLAVGILLAMFAGEQTMAFFWQRSHPAPGDKSTTEIVRNASPENVRPDPVPSPMTKPIAGRVSAVPPAAAKVKQALAPPRVTAKLKAPAVAVTPIATPPDATPTPSPTPGIDPTDPPTQLPEPTPPPNAGQVLGDSTEAPVVP